MKSTHSASLIAGHARRWLRTGQAAVAWLALALGTWALGSATAAAQTGPLTVTDVAGRTVRLPAQIDRILLGEGRLISVLGMLEGTDPTRRLVGMMGDYETLDSAGYAQWRNRFPQLDKVPRVGRAGSQSFSDEQAIALQPQLAILGLSGGHGPGLHDKGTVARLEAAGTAVVFVDFRQDPLRNTPRSIELLGTVLGKRKQADAFVADWRAQLARVTSRLQAANAKPPSVYLENRVGLSDDCCATMVGMVGLLLDAAGGHNVARGLVSGEHGVLSPEFLLTQQPQVYIGTGIGSMATRQQSPMRVVLGADATPEAARASLARTTQRRFIAQLTAVQAGRAHAIWHQFLNSPFNVVAVQVMAKWLYPDLFADLDPQATMQALYTRHLPIALSGVYWTSL